MKTIKLIYIILIVVGCKSLEIPAEQELKTIPGNYQENSELATNEGMSWKTHFNDSVLLQYLEVALNENLDALQALERINMLQSRFTYAKGLSIPFVSGIASAGQRRFGAYTMDGIGNYDTNFSPNLTDDQYIKEHLPDYLVGVQASWEIDVWGKLKNKRKAALANYLASEEGYKWIVTNLVANISIIYYSLIALEYELNIINDTKTLQERALEIVKLQKLVGKVNELAVNQFEAQLYNFQALTLEKEREKQLLENQFNFLLGRFPDKINLIEDESADEALFNLSPITPQNLLSTRPDVRKAELELVAAKADLKAAKMAFYPSLQLQGLAGFQGFNAPLLFSPQSITYSIFGNLMGPLLNRSAIQAEFDFSKAAQKAAFYQYQQSIFTAFYEVLENTISIDMTNKLIDLKSKESKVIEMALENSNELFISGQANYIEIVIARTNYLRSQLELINAKRDQKIAYINLYRSLGGG